MSDLLPTLFVSHGSPMLPLEPGTAGPMLQALGRALPRPKAILAFSPHWMAQAPTLGTNPNPETLYDFGGFDPMLRRLRYEAKGEPALASRAAQILQAAGWPVRQDPTRGLDHGVWSPLQLLFPDADIPVVPLAMPWPFNAVSAFQLGRDLSRLRAEGVLLFGTGSLTHNLHEFHANAAPDAPVNPYVFEFVDWIKARILRGDPEPLFDYRKLAPHADRAHPTDEHLLPLFWALGAGDGAIPTPWAGGVHYGMLSMDAWIFTPRG